ncbi:MarR family winged helix-turn-helix transcriptional regulator [Maribacter sp. 2-571]|uniref:MarR family winged helix-turn-helix transcriptional regulator n=1 Tax=Maribacter sp. 2-571 TaxID=3417569 RepID=UPI003D343B81
MDYYLQEAMVRHKLDLTKEQMIVLKKLHDNNGITQNELASLTYRDKSSLARLLTKMEDKGYIKRKQSEKDRRSNSVFLTPKGRDIFKKSRPVIRELLTIMEQDMSKEEKQKIIQLLQKVQQNFTHQTKTP